MGTTRTNGMGRGSAIACLLRRTWLSLLALGLGAAVALGVGAIALSQTSPPSPASSPNGIELNIPQPSQFSQTEPERSSSGEQGTAAPVIVGEFPVFFLQSTQFPSDLRVLNVKRRIDEFLVIESDGTIPMPDVRVLQDANNQYVLYLGEAGRFNDTRAPLFTVTYEDAAAELQEDAPFGQRLALVRRVAETWDDELEDAIERARQDKLDLRRARQPLYLALSIVSSLAALTAMYPLIRLSDRLLRRGQTWVAARAGENWSGWLELIVFCLTWGARVAIAAGCLHLALYAMPLLRSFQRWLYFHIGTSIRAFLRILHQPIVPNTSFSISSLALFGVLTAIAYAIARNLSLLIRDRFLRRSNLDLGTQETTATAIQYLLTLIGTIVVLPSAGIDFSSIALVAGAVGLGIGFGLQNLSNNFISGLVVLFERPIQVGDYIEIEDLQGTVERISIRATAIRTQDNIYVIVPNSRFVENNVVNWSYRSPRCRIHITVGVAYHSDPAEVQEALLEAARSNPRVLTNPEPRVWLSDFGDSALNFHLLVWTSRPQARFDLESELNINIISEFRARDIEIPFPQRDVHIKSADSLRDIWVSSHSNGRSLDPPSPNASNSSAVANAPATEPPESS